MDFTLKTYEDFLLKLSENKISVYGIGEWIKSKPKNGILLRHDVDRKPKNSLKVAELEKKYNILSSYYFRIVKSSFNSSIIKNIGNYNHEIGYHYEDLSLAKGDSERAINLFENHLNRFREICPITTISMHGRPLSPYDNRDLWKTYNFEDYKISGEAFLSIDYSDMYYFTDTGRSWSNDSLNLRDNVNKSLQADLKNTASLIQFILNNKNTKIAVITHPERWSNNFFEHLINLLKDSVINMIKRIIKLIRKNVD